MNFLLECQKKKKKATTTRQVWHETEAKCLVGTISVRRDSTHAEAFHSQKYYPLTETLYFKYKGFPKQNSSESLCHHQCHSRT